MIIKNLKSELEVKKNNYRLDLIRGAHNARNKKRGEFATYRMEDYLEVIYELIQQKGYATTTDISENLDVSTPSVTKMLKRLDKTGHLKYQRYRGIKLTQLGTAIAKDIQHRHSIISEFLRILGVDEATANKDAEGIEHHLHQETIKKLEEFIKYNSKKA